MSASSPADRLTSITAPLCALASLALFAWPGSRRTLAVALPLGVIALALAARALHRARGPKASLAAGGLLLCLLVLGVEVAALMLARA